MTKTDVINQNCLQFLTDNLDYKPITSKWFKKVGAYTYMSLEDVHELSLVLNVPIQELVVTHGFGSSTITIEQMQTLLDEQGDGYELGISEYVSRPAA